MRARGRLKVVAGPNYIQIVPHMGERDSLVLATLQFVQQIVPLSHMCVFALTRCVYLSDVRRYVALVEYPKAEPRTGA